MSEFEHPDQEKFESIELTTDQWQKVLEKAEDSEGRELHMFILRPHV